MHPGFSAQLHLYRRTMARTGVSARSAPAQRPSCGQGGRGGGLGGWCWERGGAPVVKHRVAPGTGQQTKGLPVFFPSLSLPLLHGNIFYFQTVGGLFGFFLNFFPSSYFPLPPRSVSLGARPLSRGPPVLAGCRGGAKACRAPMPALPAPSPPAQWGHSGGHRVTQHQPRARDTPPHPPRRPLPSPSPPIAVSQIAA